MNKQEELFKLCQKFIKDHNISCGECIYQQDQVIIDAYEFIGDICEIVGYVETEDEE